MIEPTLRCSCSGEYLQKAFTYNAPPPGEVSYDLTDQIYNRGYNYCRLCHHWFASTSMDLSKLYEGNYVDSTYGDQLHQAFEKIIALSPDTSDNIGRIECIKTYADKHFNINKPIRLLDVGAGLGVFPYAVKRIGWHCTAIDPDPRSVSHLQEHIGVTAIQGDFLQVPNLGQFDIITFNKVLEHVEDPIAMLIQSQNFLSDKGFIYIELPDGEMSQQEGQDREEFFIEHLHVFSLSSIALLAIRSGLTPCLIERLQEPSKKYTLRLFAVTCNNKIR